MSFKKGMKKIGDKAKSLFGEFKDFVNKGSVLDLAVGMIIGSAFTAIVTALVNNLLKPLINLIPVKETGLQTVLRPAITDASGNILTEALIIDWGAIISAIITFFITALVLFAIVKAINSARDLGKKELDKIGQKIDDGINGKDDDAENTAEVAPEAEITPEAETALVVEETVAASDASDEDVKELLRQIRDLLKANENK